MELTLNESKDLLELLAVVDSTGYLIATIEEQFGKEYKQEAFDYNKWLNFLIERDKTGKWIKYALLNWKDIDFKKAFLELQKRNIIPELTKAEKLYCIIKFPKTQPIYLNYINKEDLFTQPEIWSIESQGVKKDNEYLNWDSLTKENIDFIFEALLDFKGFGDIVIQTLGILVKENIL